MIIGLDFYELHPIIGLDFFIFQSIIGLDFFKNNQKGIRISLENFSRLEKIYPLYGVWNLLESSFELWFRIERLTRKKLIIITLVFMATVN